MWMNFSVNRKNEMALKVIEIFHDRLVCSVHNAGWSEVLDWIKKSYLKTPVACGHRKQAMELQGVEVPVLLSCNNR